MRAQEFGEFPPLWILFAREWRKHVVGLSSGAGGVRAFLWENGVMKDLNTLKAPGYTNRLEIAGDINDIGEIMGRAFNPSTGERPAFLAIPR